jgi:hypothetical protein
MPIIEETVHYIANAPDWDQRVARIRQIPARHGTSDHATIYAEIARRLYVAHLAPDYAYVPVTDFYSMSFLISRAPTRQRHGSQRTSPGLGSQISRERSRKTRLCCYRCESSPGC